MICDETVLRYWRRGRESIVEYVTAGDLFKTNNWFVLSRKPLFLCLCFCLCVSLSICLSAVSYTHLTLPTKTLV